MDLEVMEAYANSKLNVFTLNLELDKKQKEVDNLYKLLDESIHKDDLKKYFNVYDKNSIFIDENNKEELLKLLDVKDTDN